MPPKLTEEQIQLAMDLPGALTAVHERHRSERERELWLEIQRLERAMVHELRSEKPDRAALRRVNQLRLECLTELGLPRDTSTSTRRRAG